MGQAKARGTYEDRVSQAKQRGTYEESKAAAMAKNGEKVNQGPVIPCAGNTSMRLALACAMVMVDNVFVVDNKR